MNAAEPNSTSACADAEQPAGPAPKVSIGLPVYNGERYLRESIDSILAQTFTDFELVICDNASTDSTEAICREYAARDARIRYYRNPTNIGGSNNHNLTVRRSRGEYFRWAAHDDICRPQLLEKCVEVLDRHPEAALVCTGIQVIDGEGNYVRDEIGGAEPFGTTLARFRYCLDKRRGCAIFYGLLRRDALMQTRLEQNYTDSDRVLLCELGLRGTFEQIPDMLFYKRRYEANQYKDHRGRMAWFLPELATSGKVTCPFWLQYFDYLTTIRRVPLPFWQKALCHLWMGEWLRLYGDRMIKDLLVAAYMLLRSPEWRRAKYANTAEWA